jgi:hypothetical protein
VLSGLPAQRPSASGGRRLPQQSLCRHHEANGGRGRDIGRGLARIEPARGTLVLYSAKEGTIAADGDGADSPFATALAKHLSEPGIEVDKMFRLVIVCIMDHHGTGVSHYWVTTTMVKVTHVRLCHSRMPFVRAYPRESQEMVFDAHDRALACLRAPAAAASTTT